MLAIFGISDANSEIDWSPPKAEDIEIVSNFPKHFVRRSDVTLNVSKELIMKFLNEGKILAGSRRADVMNFGKLSLASGSLVGWANEKEKVIAKSHAASYGLAGLVAADGVIVTRGGEIYFFELLNDRALALYRDPGENLYSLKDNENRIFLTLPEKDAQGVNG